MSYINPLHPPVASSQRSQFSSLGGAVPVSAPQTHTGPFRRRLPQPPYTPASKWRNATGRLNPLHSAITFEYANLPNQGVSMREMSVRSGAALASMVKGAGDAVLAHAGVARINLRIIWPGYEHVDWARSIEVNTASGPITRAQLAVIISQNFARFIEKNRSEPARSSDWHMGPSGIRYEHLFLMALRNVFEDVWQADVVVVDP
ncbi:hypothetical protein H0H81_010478 [Sphagnurus paluster]|uniref:Uncharacterized protein n=1 Tax=Sphagnurus paluster TaxID=117069 RepID=A0A9P7KKU7_9AGAR|nr:hypothetical protein H0H81_010478 [Sphagnurus paluster]